MTRLEQALNIADLKKIATGRLPPPIFNYIDGGADDEMTRFGNTQSFENSRLVPEYLVDVSHIDTSTRILGQDVDWPVMLSPTGMNRLFHHEGERAVARAAAASGSLYCLSTLGSCNIEEIAEVSGDSPRCFQIYVMKDRGLSREFIQRCKESGYGALCLTVDVPVAGYRERELRYGFKMPPKLRPATFAGIVSTPGWCLKYLTSPKPVLANVAHRIADGSSKSSSLMEYIATQFDPSVSWPDLEWMIAEWGGPFAIKGILSPKDARTAVDVGVTAIMVSNHGGRQLDHALTAFEALGPIVDEVGGECEIICDGGIRRGTHVLKALARGATACSMGRPYLWGLAAGGEAGVARAITLLKAEFERDMKLLGCHKVSDISVRHIA